MLPRNTRGISKQKIGKEKFWCDSNFSNLFDNCTLQLWDFYYHQQMSQQSFTQKILFCVCVCIFNFEQKELPDWFQNDQYLIDHLVFVSILDNKVYQ